jgi:hypothetical protein
VAAKVERADVLALTFDPAQCSATGFRFADSWIFPADPAERRSFNANMVGVKASAGSVLDVIDEAHGRGEVNLRRAAAEAFPGLLVRFDGEPLARQWGATGGGGSGSSTDDGSTFERNLGRCIVDGVGVVLVHLRSSNSLLAYASHSVIPSSA